MRYGASIVCDTGQGPRCQYRNSDQVKSKFISNKVSGLFAGSWLARREPFFRSHARLLATLCAIFVIALGFTHYAEAQQMEVSLDAPAAQAIPPPNLAPAPTTDTPADFTTEAMFPHFATSRLWLSGNGRERSHGCPPTQIDDPPTSTEHARRFELARSGGMLIGAKRFRLRTFDLPGSPSANFPAFSLCD